MKGQAQTPARPLFQLHKHRLSYGGKPVLVDITLTIEAGETVALVGESGSGKSTLLRLLRAQHAGLCSYCPQHLGLVDPLSVFHNIYMGRLNRYNLLSNLRNLLWPHPQRLAEVRELTEQLGLTEQLLRSVDRLSGGQQQRTALGRALHQQSPVFIGDEPVSAVDEFQADTLLELINSRHDTVVVALHDQQLALKHYQRIIGLRQGRIVLDAASHQLSPADLAGVYRT